MQIFPQRCTYMRQAEWKHPVVPFPFFFAKGAPFKSGRQEREPFCPHHWASEWCAIPAMGSICQRLWVHGSFGAAFTGGGGSEFSGGVRWGCWVLITRAGIRLKKRSNREERFLLILVFFPFSGTHQGLSNYPILSNLRAPLENTLVASMAGIEHPRAHG